MRIKTKVDDPKTTNFYLYQADTLKIFLKTSFLYQLKVSTFLDLLVHTTLTNTNGYSICLNTTLPTCPALFLNSSIGTMFRCLD